MTARSWMPKPTTAHWRWGVAVVIAAVIVDQTTKSMILASQTFRALDCLGDERTCGSLYLSSVFSLSMTWNHGVSFGLAQSAGWARWLLTLVQLGVAGLFAGWLIQAARPRLALALSMVIGGAIGNVIDRVRFGAVVDFLNFGGPWFGWHIGGWPVGFQWVFNVADACISIGAALLLLDQLLAARRTTS